MLVATAGGNAAGHSGDVAGGKSAAYAVTNNPNGTITLAVYKKSGIAGANAKLHKLGDSQVYVVPVEAGCPSISSLPSPAVPLNGKRLSIQSGRSVGGGSVTVNAQGIPAGDILVVGFETTVNGKTITTFGSARLTSAPAPSCVSLPTPPAPPAPPEGPTVAHGSGSGPSPVHPGLRHGPLLPAPVPSPGWSAAAAARRSTRVFCPPGMRPPSM